MQIGDVRADEGGGRGLKGAQAGQEEKESRGGQLDLKRQKGQEPESKRMENKEGNEEVGNLRQDWMKETKERKKMGRN